MARRRHVEPLHGVGFVSRAWLVEIIVSVSELCRELGDEFHADFIAAGSDRGAKRGHQIGRFTAEFELHAANGLLSDAGECAAPASMNNGDGALLWIDEENRHAISSLHAEQKAGRV